MADTTPSTPSTGSSGGSFWQTPAGLALLQGGLGLTGGTLQGIGQAQMAEANRNLSQTELLQQLLQQAYNQQASQGIQRAGQGLSASQMNPAAQAQGLSNALVRGDILKNLRPSSVQAPGFLQGFVPQLSGGAMSAIPQGGFGPEITGALSPTGVLASATAFNKQQANANPNTPTMDLGPAFGAAGTAATADIDKYRLGQLSQLNNTNNAQLSGLQNALAQAQQQDQGDDGSGFWHKFAKIAGIAGAGLATALTAGGASPLLAAAIGAGSGAASGWGSGGGVGGALGGAAMGGLLPYGTSKVAGMMNPTSGGSFTPSSPCSPMLNPGGNVAGPTSMAGMNPLPGATQSLPGLPSLNKKPLGAQ